MGNLKKMLGMDRRDKSADQPPVRADPGPSATLAPGSAKAAEAAAHGDSHLRAPSPAGSSSSNDSYLPPYEEHAPHPRQQPAMAAPPLGPPPGHGMQQTGQRAGMLGGGYAGMVDGQGMGNGLWEGGVVGGMVGQQVDQHQNRQYWRDVEARYHAGHPIPGINGVPVNPDGTPPTHRQERYLRRAEKHQRRWDRRARR